MNNDDFLSDIEKDISGDWKHIQTNIEHQEKKEYLKTHPKVPNISYKDFYKLIVNIFYSIKGKDGGVYLGQLIHVLSDIFFRKKMKKMPESFEQVWNIFCDHSEYIHAASFCKRCNTEYDIIFKDQRFSFRRFGQHRMLFDKDYIMKQEAIRVYCPLCSYPIHNIMVGAILIGVFQHERKTIDEKTQIDEIEWE